MTPFIKRGLVCVFLIAAVSLFFLFAPAGGYAMQPPPPPLSIDQFKIAIAKADLIVVATVDQTQKTAETVTAVLSVERILRGKHAGKVISIQEIRRPFARPISGTVPRAGEQPRTEIVAHRAGPDSYHGRYRQGDRIVVLLEKIKESGKYRPLGSGSYDKHLCEFLIDCDGIKTLYFMLADDIKPYAGCEQRFIGLINKLIQNIAIRDEEEDVTWIKN